MVVAFCDRLGWNYYKAILDGFSERIAFGVSRNLTDLVRIAGIDAVRARAFYAANITTVASLANCTPDLVVKVLRAAVPFIKSSGNDLDYNRWLRGEKLMSDTEAAELLITRAKSEVFASLREMGLFTESQISILLKKSSSGYANGISSVSLKDDAPTGDCNRSEKGETEYCGSKRSFCSARGNINENLPHSVNENTVLPYQGRCIGVVSSKESNSEEVGSLTHQMKRCSLSNVNSSVKMTEFSGSNIDVLDGATKYPTSDFSDTASDSFLAAVNTQLSESSSSQQQYSSNCTTSPQEVTVHDASTVLMDRSNSDIFHSSLEEDGAENVSSTSEATENNGAVEPCGNSPISTMSSFVRKPYSPIKDTSGILDHSYDLFDGTYSSQSPEVIPFAKIKRVRDVRVALSPMTPTTRSPLMKQSKCSEYLKKVDGLSGVLKNSPNNFTAKGIPPKILDVCSSYKQWKAFIANAKEWKEIGFSFAFDSNNNYSCKNLIGVSVCPPDGFPAFISLNDSPVYGEDDEENQYPSFTPLDSISISERVETVKMLLCSAQQKYVFNILAFSRQLYLIPFDYRTAESVNNLNCLQMLSFIANYRSSDGSGPCHSLRELLNKLPPSLQPDVIPYRSGRIRSCIDAFLCVKLFPHLYSLAVSQTSKDAVELELKAIGLLARMEATGVPFSSAAAEKMSASVKSELCSLENKAYEISGAPFNFDSPSEIANVLFVRLKLPPVDGSGTTTKRHFSTNKAVLEKLAENYEIANIVLKWRKLNTALSLSLNSLLKFCSSDGRIHAAFFPYTLTGRVQSTSPNVQNVQKNEVICGLSVRSLFIAASGMTLVAADYRQLEMRILAHFCGDPGLRQLFNSKNDFFQTMSEYWNDNPMIKVKIDRQKVKQLCYGLIYGMGAATLSEQLGVSKNEARNMIEAFFKQFPRVRIWIDKVVEDCHSENVRTLLGRKFFSQEVKKSERNSDSSTDRRAVNYVIQGTASEIFKRALLNIEQRLKGSRARIVMQIHDEVIIEAPDADVKEVSELIKKSMCNGIFPLTIPLAVKVSLGTCWGEMKELSTV